VYNLFLSRYDTKTIQNKKILLIKAIAIVGADAGNGFHTLKALASMLNAQLQAADKVCLSSLGLRKIYRLLTVKLSMFTKYYTGFKLG